MTFMKSQPSPFIYEDSLEAPPEGNIPSVRTPVQLTRREKTVLAIRFAGPFIGSIARILVLVGVLIIVIYGVKIFRGDIEGITLEDHQVTGLLLIFVAVYLLRGRGH